MITGAASGIGQASVSLALKSGMKVAAIDKSEKIFEIWQNQEDVLPLCLDVSIPEGVNAAFIELEAYWGNVATKLISAHGIYRFKDSVNLTAAEWHEVIASNLDSTFFVLQAFGRSLITKNKKGAAVAISSIAAQRGDRIEPGAHYTASKAALIGLVGQLAVEWGSAGIRINAVSPGYIDTPMLRITDDVNRTNDITANAIPLQRLGQAREVAVSCLWLLSEDASYITGANLPIDGGISVT